MICKVFLGFLRFAICHSLPKFCKPLLTLSCHFPFWRMSHPSGLDIRLTAEVLDYGFTSDVISSGHVERTSVLFAAVESQLGERQASDLSLFMAVFVRTIWSLVIPRYEVLTGRWEGEVEPITMLETRSHPPEMNICMLLYIFLIRKTIDHSRKYHNIP